MKIIALTGGLASGKSTATQFLLDKGANIVDADKLGHRVYDTGTQAYRKVIETFGDDVVGDDNHIDRKVLGQKVFADPAELKKLTDIVWPEIRLMAELEIAALDAIDPDNVCVLEAAVLFEAGWDDIADEVWAIVVDTGKAIERAMARDNSTREAVESRLASQLSNEERSSRADVIIENDGSPDELIQRLEKEWTRVKNG